MIIVISDEAEADLEHIAEVIGRDNPRRSASFVRELVQRCERLTDMPRRFALLPGHEQTNIRRIVHGQYLIFYSIEDEVINIIHILNSATDYERILFPED
jgi:toxin ParE1/3/4